MEPGRSISPKLAVAMTAEEVASDSDRNDLDNSHSSGRGQYNVGPDVQMDMEGVEAEGAVRSTRGMTAIVDAEQMMMEQWMEDKRLRDEEAVRKWLDIIEYGQYFELFVRSGFVRIDQVQLIKDVMKLEAIGITDSEHQMELMAAIRDLQY